MSDFDGGDGTVGISDDADDDDERRTDGASTADARGGVSLLVEHALSPFWSESDHNGSDDERNSADARRRDGSVREREPEEGQAGAAEKARAPSPILPGAAWGQFPTTPLLSGSPSRKDLHARGACTPACMRARELARARVCSL